MAENDEFRRGSIPPLAVTTLRQECPGGRVAMERTASMDIRRERDDLKEAAEQSLNIILDLGLDGIVRWVSPSWSDVVGTPGESVKDKPIADLLLSNKDAFAEAAESMKKDDSRSKIVRFQLPLGPSSILKRRPIEGENEENVPEEDDEEESVLNLEGQGIMVYDRSSGQESHVSWQRHTCWRFGCH